MLFQNPHDLLQGLSYLSPITGVFPALPQEPLCCLFLFVSFGFFLFNLHQHISGPCRIGVHLQYNFYIVRRAVCFLWFHYNAPQPSRHSCPLDVLFSAGLHMLQADGKSLECILEPGVVAHTCNPSMWVAEAAGLCV